MDSDNSIDSVCAEEVEQSLFWFDNLGSKLQKLLSAWLKTFVIQNSSENVGEWRFRTLFVAEITMIPILLSFLFVFWWVVNRNIRLRKTKGSSIPLKEDQGDELTFDSEDDDYDDGVSSIDGVPDDQTASHAQRPTRRQKTIQALMKAYNVELDDDEHDDETMVSLESYLEDSDGEEGPPFSQADTSAAKMFLSKEKLNLWKIVKEIPVFSFLNQEAMESCIHDIEYVTVDKKDDFLWEEGKFDGSLYYVVKGRVRVNFLDFKAPYQRAFGKEKEVASVVHVEGTVVTSQLAMIEGMIRYYLGEKASSLGRFVGSAMNETTAQTMVDNALLLRIPPSCFSRILDRYPETILRIVQTTLNRTQRVTVQTLVRCCGLRSELLVPSNKGIGKSMLKDDCSHWKTLQNNLTNRRINCDKDFECTPDEEKCCLMKNACGTLANILNIEEQGTIEVLEEKCSLVSLDGSGDDNDRTLLKAGSSHDFCYLLLQGKMEIGMYLPHADYSSSQLQNDPSAWYFQRIRTISPGSIFGETALFTTDVNLFETRFAPSPECGDKCAILLQIPLDVYAQVVTRHPQAMATLLVPVLTVLSPVVHFLAWTTEWIHVEAAGEIVQKGTPCNSLFIVLNGRLRAANRAKAHAADSSEVIPPKEYGRGKIFGRVGSLANVNWPYDVFAIRQSELAKVPIKTIEVVVERFPYAGLFLARVIASDVDSLHSSKRQFMLSPPSTGFVGKLSEHGAKNSTGDSGRLPFHLPSYGLNLATIAVVPLSYNIDLKRFCTTLSQAMETIAPCKLLTKSFVKRELGEKVYRSRNALHDVKMTRLLADLEENNRVVIYQADPKFTSWTRLCVLQADYIMLVVDSQEAPKKSRVEQTIAWAYEAMDVRIDLVVVGEEAKEDASYDSNVDESYDDEDDEVSVSDQLNNWSESREWITGHHLVRAPFGRYRIDFHRMCRRISGRSIGLALGAGGARGIAHLGVIRALQEAGITVDVVGGTSQGAFCGALFARYPDHYQKVEDAFRVMAADTASVKEKLLDLTLPITSIFAGRNFNRGIKKLLGKLRIQDLVLKFFCVSVDIQNQNMVVHTKGLLWKFVRASMGMKLYLPPISENGSLLVDGIYLNCLPADVMKYQMGARTVIAVDVSQEYKREYYEYGTYLSGWWVLWNSWNPFVKTVPVPSMGDISDMLIWVSSEKHRKAVKNVCDLHLTPPIQDVGTLEYDRFDEIVEKSYNYSKPIIDEWVRKNPWLISSPKTNV